MRYSLLLFIFLCAGCGLDKVVGSTNSIPDRMDQLNNKIDRTNDQMKRTNDTVEQQPVQISFEALLNKDLGRVLFPVPFDLMPFAAKLGQYASPSDFIELVYLWIKKLNEVTLDDVAPADQKDFIHDKYQILVSLEAACGQLPQSKVEAIVAQQIYADGRYSESAMQMLMLRFLFVRHIMLENSLFPARIDNLGKLEKAIEYADQIEYMARLPFAKELGIDFSEAFKGEDKPKMPLKEQFDTGIALDTWVYIATLAGATLDVQPRDLTGDAAKDKALFKDRQMRKDKNIQLLNKRIIGWGGTPPEI